MHDFIYSMLDKAKKKKLKSNISFVSFVGKRLNEYISHHETLNYDAKHLQASHDRARRSIDDDEHVHLKFSAHGERFHLRLKRDLTTFSDHLEVRCALVIMV